MTNMESLWVTPPLSSSLRFYALEIFSQRPLRADFPRWGPPSTLKFGPGSWLQMKWDFAYILKFWYGLCSFFEREGTSNIPDPKPVIFSMKMVKMAFGVCDMFASNSKKTSYILLFQCFRGPTTINYRQKSSQVQRLFSLFGRVCMRICLQEGWEISEKREYSLNPTFGWCTFPANNPRTGRGPLICSKTAKIIKQAFLKYGNAGQR